MYESAPWRTELKKHAVVIRDAPNWPTDEVPFELEHSLFYSAVVLRKLIEDRKLTDGFCAKTLDVNIHHTSPPDKSSIWRNMPGSVDIDPSDKGVDAIAIYELCNQIVHFFAREWWVQEDGTLTSVIVCSYKHQDKRAYQIGLDEWSDILDAAANDWPSSIKLSSTGREVT